MKAKMELQFKFKNCEISELEKMKIASQIETAVLLVRETAKVDIELEKTSEGVWIVDISIKYQRAHIAGVKADLYLYSAVEGALSDMQVGITNYHLQMLAEPFHFDSGTEFDYYQELSQEMPLPQRKVLSVLLIEDDPSTAMVLKTTLKSLGCKVEHYDSPTDALKAVRDNRYNLIVLDWNLPYMNASRFLKIADGLLHQADIPGRPHRQTPVVICTGMPLDQIQLPAVSHFFFCNHWHKSLPYSSIVDSFDETTRRIAARYSLAKDAA